MIDLPSPDRPVPTGVEKIFEENRSMVSKTDAKGRILTVDGVFCEMSEYQERELIAEPYDMMRHPDMPKCIFKLMWEEIEKGNEFITYMKNLTKGGDYYWVSDKIVPRINKDKQVVGYVSYKNSPNRDVLGEIEKLYNILLRKEKSYENEEDGINAAYKDLVIFHKRLMQTLLRADS